MPDAKVLISIENQTILVKIESKANSFISQNIKKFILDNLSEKTMDIFIDMSNCESMDSTFMGIMTDLSRKLNEKCGRNLSFINIAEHNISLL